MDADLLHDLPPVASMTGDDFVAAIVESDGLFTLWWDDCVANVWVERYETLPLALLRLAVLGSLTDERRMFAEGADNFARIGAEWLDRRVTN